MENKEKNDDGKYFGVLPENAEIGFFQATARILQLLEKAVANSGDPVDVKIYALMKPWLEKLPQFFTATVATVDLGAKLATETGGDYNNIALYLPAIYDDLYALIKDSKETMDHICKDLT